MKCLFCNKVVDLNKKYTPEQQAKSDAVKKFDRMKSGKEIAGRIKDYYCDCGHRLTLMKLKGNWEVITGQ